MWRYTRWRPRQKKTLEELVRELMGNFSKLMKNEEILGEVLKLRIQDKQEVTAATKKIRDTQKKTNM